MARHDSIADFLTCLRNASAAGHRSVEFQSSKFVVKILEILERERFISAYEVLEREGKKFVSVKIRYEDSEPIITHIERVSKCSRRVYLSKDKMERVLGGIGIGIISTSLGLLTSEEARAKGVGGEFVCKVW